MQSPNQSPARSTRRGPMVTYIPLGRPSSNTPQRPRLPSYPVEGRLPSQSTASPQRTSRVTSAPYFPYDRKIQSPAELERLKARRLDYLRQWEMEQDLAEVEAMSEDDEEDEEAYTEEDSTPSGYSAFSFTNAVQESPQVVYEKKWHVLVMAEDVPQGFYAACITFADFPWPISSSQSMSAANFSIDRISMHSFLYNQARLSSRKMAYDRLVEEEQFRWDLRVIETRVLSKIVPEDREAVREAAALVFAKLYGLPDDDAFVSGAKSRLARAASRKVQYSQKRLGFEVFLWSLQSEERKQVQRQKDAARIEVPKPSVPARTRETSYGNHGPIIAASGSMTYRPLDRMDSLFGDYLD